MIFSTKRKTPADLRGSAIRPQSARYQRGEGPLRCACAAGLSDALRDKTYIEHDTISFIPANLFLPEDIKKKLHSRKHTNTIQSKPASLKDTATK